MPTDPHDDLQRRAFFRKTAARVLGPIADYLDKRLPRETLQVRLRPPGAIAEDLFLDTCQRCGECVKACPADAIFALDDSNAGGAGTPAIDPDAAACVVCEGLQCTHVCPSGALLPLFDPGEIRMGVAEVYGGMCVRSRGETCTLCVDRCPLGETAIRFVGDGPPEVLAAGCVGCGVCQLYCPTQPKAITVRPHGAAPNSY